MARIDGRDKAALVHEQSKRITALRDELEQYPITLDSGLRYDADDKSRERMEKVIRNWNSPQHTRDEQGRQLWKLANNQWTALTQVEFSAMYNELDEKLTARSDALFGYCEPYRAQLPLPDNHAVFDPATWPV